MGCFLAILLFPRFILFFIWTFTSLNDQVFKGWVWPLLGFIALPYTTLAYILAKAAGTEIAGLGAIIVVIGFIADVMFPLLRAIFSNSK